VSVVWLGVENNEIVTGHLGHGRKFSNMERDPRVTLTIESKDVKPRIFFNNSPSFTRRRYQVSSNGPTAIRTQFGIRRRPLVVWVLGRSRDR